jgi:hypothetical protein
MIVTFRHSYSDLTVLREYLQPQILPARVVPHPCLVRHEARHYEPPLVAGCSSSSPSA